MARVAKSDKKAIEQYAHKGKERLNNPPVGLVTHESGKSASGPHVQGRVEERPDSADRGPSSPSDDSSAKPRGKDLFIVDNSAAGWTGLRYLEEWAGISNAFDIATGYFEIGSLLALDRKWQGLDKIRILMGAETTHRTRKALLDAVTARATMELDASIENEKEENPFLRGVPAIVDALRRRQIDCRVFDREKFHAKAYITHAKMEVIGSQAPVGSSVGRRRRRRRPRGRGRGRRRRGGRGGGQ